MKHKSLTFYINPNSSWTKSHLFSSNCGCLAWTNAGSRSSRPDARTAWRCATGSETLFDSSRGLDKNRIMEMATCGYIKRGIPVLVTGAAGTGKSWLATALGHQACMLGYKVRYFNVFKLFEQITDARMEGTLTKLFARLADTDLIIIDDFGVRSLDKQQMLDFLELMEDRHARKSTIIVSQLPVANWYDMMKSNSTAADAILDRIVHTAARFELSGSSLRKK